LRWWWQRLCIRIAGVSLLRIDHAHFLSALCLPEPRPVSRELAEIDLESLSAGFVFLSCRDDGRARLAVNALPAPFAPTQSWAPVLGMTAAADPPGRPFRVIEKTTQTERRHS
jgi:hypothetical protein